MDRWDLLKYRYINDLIWLRDNQMTLKTLEHCAWALAGYDAFFWGCCLPNVLRESHAPRSHLDDIHLQSIHPSIHESINQSINQSIHPASRVDGLTQPTIAQTSTRSASQIRQRTCSGTGRTVPSFNRSAKRPTVGGSRYSTGVKAGTTTIMPSWDLAGMVSCGGNLTGCTCC